MHLRKATALLSIAAASVALCAASAAQQPSGNEPWFHQGRPTQEARVAGIYDPRDAIRLVGASYTVPAGRILLITALGSVAHGQVTIQISDFWADGVPETIAVAIQPDAPTVALPRPGIVVSAGSTLSVGGIVYGYLLEAPSKDKALRTESRDNPVHIVGLPGDPRAFVYIRSNPANPNFSYTVPPGKRLMVTGIGGSHDCTWVSVREAGTPLLVAELPPGRLFYEVHGPGIPIEGDRIVNPLAESAASPFPGRVIGYLVDM